jgi:hypothetical protein
MTERSSFGGPGLGYLAQRKNSSFMKWKLTNAIHYSWMHTN